MRDQPMALLQETKTKISNRQGEFAQPLSSRQARRGSSAFIILKESFFKLRYRYENRDGDGRRYEIKE